MVVPRPSRWVTRDGSYTLSRGTVLNVSPEVSRVGEWLRSVLGPPTGLGLPPGPAGTGAIRISVDPALGVEEYRLTVGDDGVDIVGGGEAGAFYGAQTLRQLLPPAVYRRARIGTVDLRLSGVDIADGPRFGWRGCLLDVARHFMPKDSLLRFVDLLAMHKLNVLHLHLTDDQGWRLEIRRYPRLTEVGGWRRESMVGSWRHARYDGRPHGGYYTQDDIREIVAYAADRHVMVVPEIDVPGHSQAAIAAYPELGGPDAPREVRTAWGINEHVLDLSSATVAFYQGVFDEVLELFPSVHIGVGGDECPAPVARRTWFIGQLDEYLTARGRRLYGWDEILDGPLSPGAVVAAWRGTGGAVAAVRAGHDVVLCPDTQTYLDYRQSNRFDEPIPVGTVLTVEEVCRFDPVLAEFSDVEAARVLGGQCNVWTEHLDSPRAVDYMVFPRLCAFAEAVWSGGARDFAEFGVRLGEHERRLDAYGVEYRRATGPRPWQTRPDATGHPVDRTTREAYTAEQTRHLLEP